MTITFISRDSWAGDLLSHDCIIAVSKTGSLGERARLLDKASDGMIAKTCAQNRHEPAVPVAMTFMADKNNLRRFFAIPMGVKDDRRLLDALMFGGKSYALGHRSGLTNVTLVFEEKDSEEAAQIALGVRLKAYRFDHYLGEKSLKKKGAPSLEAVTIVCDDPDAAQKAWQEKEAIAAGVYLARDLGFEPANRLTPEHFANKCLELKKDGVEVTLMDEKELTKLKMGALLGVAQGSANKPYVAVMRWNGGGKDKPLAFIGKGVTFDTGGISIKPSSGMEEMKMDMAGAAAVTGLMRTLARRKAKINAVGVIGLVENMPSSKAQRPGDIVRSYSQQTIEVLNTDAEGRLVLADILHYTNEQFKPQFMINLATLTGAIIIALGNHHAGLFSNDDALCEKLADAAKKSGEKLWRLPLGSEFDKMLDSPIADMQNITNQRGAGSITAAQFLKRFVGETVWAHLDIAGVAWGKSSTLAPKGASGYGVRLLNQLVKSHYEKDK